MDVVICTGIVCLVIGYAIGLSIGSSISIKCPLAGKTPTYRKKNVTLNTGNFYRKTIDRKGII